MIWHGDLAPVGNRIALESSEENLLEGQLGDYQYWLDSGTSALALALLDAKANFPDIDKPRAIIPGYCCPDLIAACVYAGVEAVAVDISLNDPSYDLEQLRLNLDSHVIAVIAVNFLGISERLNELRKLISDLNLRARVIEDNAQWFPTEIGSMQFKSDYVTFSFGRGKPMSLLGGGLLWAKEPVAANAAAHIEPLVHSSFTLKLKIAAYNLLLKPQFYQLLNRNPWLHLGETRYVPLEKIEALDAYRRTLLSVNFTRYSNRENRLSQLINKTVIDCGVQTLSDHCASRQKRLLRYPLLCPDSESRDRLLLELSAVGLGASPMYVAAIDQIAGVDGLVIVPHALVNAKNFAGRFMTLPVHEQVTQAYLARILAALSSFR